MFPAFDDLKDGVFSRVLDIMGESAVWQSSEGDVEGRILFKYPTKDDKIGNENEYLYKPNTPTAEWYKDTFVGLKESTDAQAHEFLVIRENTYLVTSVETKFDGDTYIANLELTKIDFSVTPSQLSFDHVGGTDELNVISDTNFTIC